MKLSPQEIHKVAILNSPVEWNELTNSVKKFYIDISNTNLSHEEIFRLNDTKYKWMGWSSLALYKFINRIQDIAKNKQFNEEFLGYLK